MARQVRPLCSDDYGGCIAAMEAILHELMWVSFDDRKRIVRALDTMQCNGTLGWVTGGEFVSEESEDEDE